MHTAADLLTRAAVVYAHGRGQYRDAMLETGRLLHAYILAYLQQGDGIPERSRQRLGYTRRQALTEAAASLRATRDRVSELVAVAMAVDLLGQGNVGNLGLRSLSLFWRFVTRDHGGRGNEPGRMGSVARQETWQLKPAFASQASALFRSAVAEDWAFEDVRRTVLDLYRGPAARRASPRRVHREEVSPLRLLRDAAAQASPRDAADMLLDLIRQLPDSESVSRLVREGLGRARLTMEV